MTTSTTGTELEAGGWTPEHASGEELPPGIGPYRLALRRLRRNYVALAFGLMFLIIVILCLLAPVYSHDIAHMGPTQENVDQATNSVGLPIGPTWKLSHFFLGADSVGQDVAVRLL